MIRQNQPPEGEEPLGHDESQQEREQAASGESHRGQELRDEARKQWDQAKHQAQEQANSAVQGLRERGQRAVDEQRSQVAEQVHAFADALHSAADRLREHEDEKTASYADSAADQIDSVAGYVRERDLQQVMDDVSDLARRRPEWVVGGMFLAGLTMARFIKAKPEHASYSDQDQEQGVELEGYEEEIPEHEPAHAAAAPPPSIHVEPGPPRTPRSNLGPTPPTNPGAGPEAPPLR